jgi:hypothetical protein
MSEYQYFEFRTLGRRLTPEDMKKLRSYSTRASITPTCFVNDYSWGDFKGDPDTWMEKYFDAFLYYANWGTRILKLRLPSQRLSLETARQYCNGDSASVREKDGWVILSFMSEDEEGCDWLDLDDPLSRIIAVRNQLIRGDLRALYLGWLLRAQEGELDDDDVEPPVPPGLSRLSPSLESLVDFLRIDRDLVRVAAAASQPITRTRVDHREVQVSTSKTKDPTKEEMIADLIMNTDHATLAQLLQRFVQEPADALAVPVPELWAEIERLISTRNPYRYDEAVRILIDLRDLCTRGKCGDFDSRMMDIRRAHASKPSLIQRLNMAGL